jgi:hypothetical protein
MFLEHVSTLAFKRFEDTSMTTYPATPVKFIKGKWCSKIRFYGQLVWMPVKDILESDHYLGAVMWLNP